MKTIVLTGGGSAGHVMPNMALLPLLRQNFDKIIYIGTGGMEKDIARNFGLEFLQIDAVKLERKLTAKNLLIPIGLLKAISQAKKALKKVEPDIVFSKGGFVSLPVVIAAHKLRIPVVSHESDMSMGLANKIIYRYAKCVCTGFAVTAERHKKCIYTGSPIREQIFLGQRHIGKKICGFLQERPVVMFFGGSLGSQKINNTVYHAIDLLDEYNIIHLTGKGNKSLLKQSNYYCAEWSNNIEHLYALADIIVCRAGANAINELLALNKKMILIPLSKAASRGDQIDNAKYFAKKGYAKMILEENLTPERLVNTIKNYPKVSRFGYESKNNNQKIVDIILKYCKKS